MIKKIRLLLIILLLSNTAGGQTIPERPIFLNTSNAAQLPPSTRKSMLIAANSVYETFYKFVTNAPKNIISVSLINDFCKNGFWPGAQIEIMSPITKQKKMLSPENYFQMLRRTYDKNGRYDSTSEINMKKLVLFPSIETDTDGNYKVVYQIEQTTINKKDNKTIYSDDTKKAISIKFKFDVDYHPKIEKILALESHLIK